MAETAYKAYASALGGRSADGKSITDFATLDQKTKDAWIAAVKAVTDEDASA